MYVYSPFLCISLFFFIQAKVMTVDAKLPKVHVKNSIFFLHTSAEKEISNIARCTIESAARYNPSTRIIVYSNAWNEDDTIAIHPNVYVTSYNISEIFQEYPSFTKWYHSRVWKTGYPVNNLANALRLVILHQSGGGTYLDTDVLVLRGFDALGPNSIGIEELNKDNENVFITVNSAVMVNFEQSNEYLEALLRDFIETFQGDTWGYNGPQLLSRTLVKFHDAASTWNDEVFYPIYWKDARILFESVVEHEHMLQKLNEKSVTVHLWNSLISPQLPYAKSGTVLELLVKNTCPMSYLKYFNFDQKDPLRKKLKNVNKNCENQPVKTISFDMLSPAMTINYEYITPNISLKVDFDEKERNLMMQYKFCFTLKIQDRAIIENRCHKIHTSKDLYKFQFLEENPSTLEDGKYVFYGWIKDKSSNCINSEVKIVGFHIGFRSYKRKMQQRKLKSFFHMMALRHKESVKYAQIDNDQTQEYFNAIFLYEKTVNGTNNRVDMPSFNFLEKGLLPALHKFSDQYKNKKLKSWLFGPGHTGWNYDATVQENFIHRFGTISCFDLIVVLPPPWPDDYDRDTNPTSIPPDEIKALSKFVPIAFRQAELHTHVTNQRLNLLNATFLFATYLNEIENFVNSKPSWLMSNPSKRYIIHAPHGASKDIFSCNGFINDADRPIDILLTGRLDPNTYPLRTRMFKLLNMPAVQSTYRIHIHYHPGYDLSYPKAQKQLKEYAALLKRTKINIVTTSSYKLAVAKLAETQLSGALIVGDIPDSRRKYYEKIVVDISMSNDDESILATLKWWIEHPKERLAKARVGYIYGISGETWSSWLYAVLFAMDEYQKNIVKYDSENINVFLLSTTDDFGYQTLKSNVYDNYNSLLFPIKEASLRNKLLPYKPVGGNGYQFVITCACQAASYLEAQHFFHYSSNKFDLEDNNRCNKESQTKFNMIQQGNLFNEASPLNVHQHYFFCNQYPFHTKHIDIENLLLIDEHNVALNMFPNAFKVLHEHGIDKELNSGEKSIQVNIFVSITSIDPLRVWIYSTGIASDNNSNNVSVIDFRTVTGKQRKWRKSIFNRIKSLSFNLLPIKSKCTSKCYQILEIKMNIIELDENVEVNIENIDASPTVASDDLSYTAGKDVLLLRKYILTTLYDNTWKMKGLHPNLFYPSLPDMKLWLNSNYYCNKVLDCDNHLTIMSLLSMLTEVYYSHDGPFQLIWPVDLHSNEAVANINDYTNFSESELELYNTMFFIINDIKAREGHDAREVFGKLF